jgi:hypothetical protein
MCGQFGSKCRWIKLSEFLSSRATIMAKASIRVQSTQDADPATIKRLAAKYQINLIDGVEVQRESGRPGTAVISAEGYLLVCFDRRSAEAKGFDGDADYNIFGMPEMCDLARVLLAEIRAEQTTVTAKL